MSPPAAPVERTDHPLTLVNQRTPSDQRTPGDELLLALPRGRGLRASAPGEPHRPCSFVPTGHRSGAPHTRHTHILHLQQMTL